jgi:hypothetical protein
MKHLLGLTALALCAASAAPLPAAAQPNTATTPCRDPWVSQAVREVAGREPYGAGETGECNIQLYGARWGSYDELRNYVRQARSSMGAKGLSFRPGGNVISDAPMFSALVAAGVYVGPRASAPAKPWMIDLPSGNVMALDRKCRPGYTPTGPGNQGGCVRGSVPNP